METHISMIFKIMDRFRKRPLLAAEAGIYINGHRQRPLYKAGGYFIFTDLAPGETSFQIIAPAFQQEALVALIPAPGKGYLHSHLLLNPAPAYPFGREVTTVRGRLWQDQRPYAHEHFYLIPGEGGEVMKVAEDKGEAGNTRLRLFAAVPERQLSFPGKYLIKDKDKGKGEVCLIIRKDSREGIFLLEKELQFSHVRGTPLVEVIECRTEEDGSFFAALPELKQETLTLSLLGKGPDEKNMTQNSVKTMAIHGGQANDLGDIQIE